MKRLRVGALVALAAGACAPAAAVILAAWGLLGPLGRLWGGSGEDVDGSVGQGGLPGGRGTLVFRHPLGVIAPERDRTRGGRDAHCEAPRQGTPRRGRAAGEASRELRSGKPGAAHTGGVPVPGPAPPAGRDPTATATGLRSSAAKRPLRAARRLRDGQFGERGTLKVPGCHAGAGLRPPWTGPSAVSAACRITRGRDCPAATLGSIRSGEGPVGCAGVRHQWDP